MTFSTLPLSYCTNVHPGQTVHEITHGLINYSGKIRKACAQPVAAGLWLAASVIEELSKSDFILEKLKQTLKAEKLITYTLNTFPYGNFHQEVVKDQVYLPNWSQPERLDYTIKCALILEQLLPDGIEGSLSTVPLGFKNHVSPHDKQNFFETCIDQLLQLCKKLDDLHDESGKVIRLAIEPEPYCILETTQETIRFFNLLFKKAETLGLEEAARRHLGVCYDVCHQSVEFEDVSRSIQELHEAGIRINKIHITCAVEIPTNEQGLAALKKFNETRYLHQTFGRNEQGDIRHTVDLVPELWEQQNSVLKTSSILRIHYHVPVYEEHLEGVSTTRRDLIAALREIQKLDYAPHLEIETYTWGVLPGTNKPELAAGITREFQATWRLINELQQL